MFILTKSLSTDRTERKCYTSSRIKGTFPSVWWFCI